MNKKNNEKKTEKYANQMERLERTKINLDLLEQALIEQNRREKPGDLENESHMMFKRGGKKGDDPSPAKNNSEANDDDEAPLTA